MDKMFNLPINQLPGLKLATQLSGDALHKSQTHLPIGQVKAAVQDPDLSKWYEPGIDDCYYEDAWKVNTAVRDNLTKTHGELMSEWRRSWSADPHALSIYFEQRVMALAGNKTSTKASKRKDMKDAIKKLGTGLVKLATALDPLISSLLPSSPEYAIPYACLKVILKFITDITTDRAEEIEVYVENLRNTLEQMRFQSDMKPTGAMKLLMAKVYVQVLEFLERLVEFSTFPMIEKLRIYVTKSRKEYKFDDRLVQIQDLKKELDEAAKMSMRAMQKEEFLMIREFAAVIPILYGHSREIHLATRLSVNSHAVATAHLLINILLPGDEDLREELELWRTVKFRLSLGDRWDHNGVLKKLAIWSKSDDNMFFVVGPCGSKDSWVTHFSLDLIFMLQRDQEPVTFALCDRPDHQGWTPAIMTKNLILQLLRQHPILALQYPEICNATTFHRAKEFPQIWKVFWSLVSRLDSLYIVIDRLDLCRDHPNAESNKEEELLYNLVTIGRDMGGKVKIILTSAKSPTSIICERMKLCYTLVNTQKRPKQRARMDLESEDEISSGYYSEYYTDNSSQDN